MKARARILFSVALIFIPIWMRAADSTNPFSFADPIVRIPSAAQDGAAQITLRSSVDQPTAPSIRDVELPHPFAATVKFDPIKDADAPKNSWRFSVTVTGLAPANAMQQRYAIAEYADKKTQTIPYFLTNQPLSAFTWAISKPPDPWVNSDWLPTAGCTAFTVTPKDSPATGLTISSANLVEQVTKHAITVRDLRLCRNEECSGDNAPIDLPPNRPTKVLLCTTRSFHGNYHGSVALASLQKPDGEAILQNIDLSSFLLKLLGVIAIGVGVYLAWWAKVWARARLERDQALTPAVVMRTQLRTLQQILLQLRGPYRAAPTNLSQSITTLLGELDDAELDRRGFLPPKFPTPYGYTVDSAGYKAYLEARNPKIQLVSALIRQGVVRAEAEDNGTLPAAKQAQVATAISDIDRICVIVPQPTAEQALALVQPILTNLHNTLFPPLAVVPPAAPPLPVNPAHEYEVLSLEMQSISKGVWLLYGVLTALSGLVVLILNNPGFGVPVDLVFALFWGFGLPTTVGALAPSSAATALNIPIAKS
jgi:hypothetical protein